MFFQLHLKKLLIDNQIAINEVLSSTNDIVIDEPWYTTKRKIGQNEIVKKAFTMLTDSEAYYIGLIPSSNSDIQNFKTKTVKAPDDPITKNIHLVSWHDVKAFCDLKKYKKEFKNVNVNFEYNRGQIFNEL